MTQQRHPAPLSGWIGEGFSDRAREFADRAWRERGVLIIWPGELTPMQAPLFDALGDSVRGKRK